MSLEALSLLVVTVFGHAIFRLEAALLMWTTSSAAHAFTGLHLSSITRHQREMAP